MQNKVNLVTIELNLLEDGDLELIRKVVDHKKFVNTMNEEFPEYENTMIIAAAIRNMEWESDELFEYMGELIRGL